MNTVLWIDKRSGGREGLGRSRGGLSTKIHLVADRRCRPVARLTSPGQHGDSPRFVPLMKAIRIRRRGLGLYRAKTRHPSSELGFSLACGCPILGRIP